MSGILFVQTKDLESVTKFYADRVGMTLWLAQQNVNILKHGNLLIGLHDTGKIDSDGLITFFVQDKAWVDEMYERMGELAVIPPVENPAYNIYHFFAQDPEGRKLEFQAFLHPVEPYLQGDELVAGRRSVREFEGRDVPDETLRKVMELCRWSPTSMNSQSYHFVATRDKAKKDLLSKLRGGSSAPIARAPLAVAICADPGKSGAAKQDADIAAYHFMLACAAHNLGTCWIAAMDRAEVKEALSIPDDHFVATVTPVGFPIKPVKASLRRDPGEFFSMV